MKRTLKKRLSQTIYGIERDNTERAEELRDFFDELKHYGVLLRNLSKLFYELDGMVKSSDIDNSDERIHHVTTSNDWMGQSLNESHPDVGATGDDYHFFNVLADDTAINIVHHLMVDVDASSAEQEQDVFDTNDVVAVTAPVLQSTMLEFSQTDHLLGPLSAHAGISIIPDKGRDKAFDQFCDLMSEGKMLPRKAKTKSLFGRETATKWFTRESLWAAYCNHIRATPLIVCWKEDNQEVVAPEQCIDVFKDNPKLIPNPINDDLDQMNQESNDFVIAMTKWISIVPPKIWSFYIKQKDQKQFREATNDWQNQIDAITQETHDEIHQRYSGLLSDASNHTDVFRGVLSHVFIEAGIYSPDHLAGTKFSHHGSLHPPASSWNNQRMKTTDWLHAPSARTTNPKTVSDDSWPDKKTADQAASTINERLLESKGREKLEGTYTTIRNPANIA